MFSKFTRISFTYGSYGTIENLKEVGHLLVKIENIETAFDTHLRMTSGFNSKDVIVATLVLKDKVEVHIAESLDEVHDRIKDYYINKDIRRTLSE